MQPGVYIQHPDLGTRKLASLDEVRLGDTETQQSIADDLYGHISDIVLDVATDLGGSQIKRLSVLVVS